MKRVAIILLALVAALTAGVSALRPYFDFWMQTGYFAPVRQVETLPHPVAVTSWDATGLVLADGRRVDIPGVSELPSESPALREVLKRGVEVQADGRILALVEIHHWCGNDPVLEHVVQVDLADLLLFLRVGQPTTLVPDEDLLMKPGGDFSEYGWNISEYGLFELWQSSKQLAAIETND